MKSIIKSAKTIEEAIDLGVKELGISRSNAEVEIIQEPSKGILGLFGGNDAVVKVKEKAEVKIDLDDIFSESEKKEDLSDIEEDYLEETDKYATLDEEDDEELFVEEEVYLQDIDESEEDFEVYSEENHSTYEDSSKEEDPNLETINDESKNDDTSEETSEYDDLYEDGAVLDFEEEAHKDLNEDSEDDNELEYELFKSDESFNTRDLEFTKFEAKVTPESSFKEVAEITKKTLEDILIKMHIDAKVNYETAKDNIINLNLTDISENDTGIVIGAKGETLNAVQYVLSLLINKNANKFYRITINVGDYRDRRKKSIEQNAQRVAYKVLKTKKPIALKPMNSYERRIVHFSLQNYKQIETVSIGKFPNRKVIIRYKGL